RSLKQCGSKRRPRFPIPRTAPMAAGIPPRAAGGGSATARPILAAIPKKRPLQPADGTPFGDYKPVLGNEIVHRGQMTAPSIIGGSIRMRRSAARRAADGVPRRDRSSGGGRRQMVGVSHARAAALRSDGRTLKGLKDGQEHP